MMKAVTISWQVLEVMTNTSEPSKPNTTFLKIANRSWSLQTILKNPRKLILNSKGLILQENMFLSDAQIVLAINLSSGVGLKLMTCFRKAL